MSLSKYFGAIQDSLGNAVVGATVSVYFYLAGRGVATTNPAKCLYDDSGNLITNAGAAVNYVTTDASGRFSFNIPDGVYDINIVYTPTNVWYYKVAIGQAGTSLVLLSSPGTTVIDSVPIRTADATTPLVTTGCVAWLLHLVRSDGTRITRFIQTTHNATTTSDATTISSSGNGSGDHSDITDISVSLSGSGVNQVAALSVTLGAGTWSANITRLQTNSA